MLRILILGFIVTALLTPTLVLARTTPDQIYQASRAQFQSELSGIQDPNKRQLVIQADQELSDTNQKVCDQFNSEITLMGSVMQELERRNNITSATAGFGGLNTPIDQAEYYLNFAEEAVAYQKIQDYTPDVSPSNPGDGIQVSLANLQSSLNVLQTKVQKAKQYVNLAVNYYEK